MQARLSTTPQLRIVCNCQCYVWQCHAQRHEQQRCICHSSSMHCVRDRKAPTARTSAARAQARRTLLQSHGRSGALNGEDAVASCSGLDTQDLQAQLAAAQELAQAEGSRASAAEAQVPHYAKLCCCCKAVAVHWIMCADRFGASCLWQLFRPVSEIGISSLLCRLGCCKSCPCHNWAACRNSSRSDTAARNARYMSQVGYPVNKGITTWVLERDEYTNPYVLTTQRNACDTRDKLQQCCRCRACRRGCTISKPPQPRHLARCAFGHMPCPGFTPQQQ